MISKVKYIALALFFITLLVFFINRFVVLAHVLSFSDAGSRCEDICTRFIYSMPVDKVENAILEDLRLGKRKYLINQYIRIGSVFGIERLNRHFLNIYVKYESIDGYDLMKYNLITAIGVIGILDNVNFLGERIDGLSGDGLRDNKYEIARSLFLLGSNNNKYLNSQNFTITNELREVRNAVRESIGRERTFDEKMIIDQIYRPPKGWKS
ncbi:hypothetical protein [uncultured Desulfuromusa sp.]|uniref:hypothetical protein n=1 Tax=uncultured Desulfuromusa sp. TaxID=219183 RepID=UPI002AA5E895|nr:hypothetical protein [uncultured Desulfuromusa sp.]